MISVPFYRSSVAFRDLSLVDFTDTMISGPEGKVLDIQNTVDIRDQNNKVCTQTTGCPILIRTLLGCGPRANPSLG